MINSPGSVKIRNKTWQSIQLHFHLILQSDYCNQLIDMDTYCRHILWRKFVSCIRYKKACFANSSVSNYYTLDGLHDCLVFMLFQCFSIYLFGLTTSPIEKMMKHGCSRWRKKDKTEPCTVALTLCNNAKNNLSNPLEIFFNPLKIV